MWHVNEGRDLAIANRPNVNGMKTTGDNKEAES